MYSAGWDGTNAFVEDVEAGSRVETSHGGPSSSNPLDDPLFLWASPRSNGEFSADFDVAVLGVWSRVLTPREIKLLWQNPFAPVIRSRRKTSLIVPSVTNDSGIGKTDVKALGSTGANTVEGGTSGISKIDLKALASTGASPKEAGTSGIVKIDIKPLVSTGASPAEAGTSGIVTVEIDALPATGPAVGAVSGIGKIDIKALLGKHARSGISTVEINALGSQSGVFVAGVTDEFTIPGSGATFVVPSTGATFTVPGSANTFVIP